MKPKCCQDNQLTKDISQSITLLKAISEENRLKILCLLKKGERCVCDIWQDLGIPQNLASHHLKILKEEGLITSRKEGLSVYYRANNEKLSKFNLLLNNLFQNEKRRPNKKDC